MKTNTNTVTITPDGPYPYMFFYANPVDGACRNVGLGLDKNESDLTLQDLRAVERFIADDLTGLGCVRNVHVVLTGYKRIASLV